MREDKYITKIIAASLLGDGYVGINGTKYPSYELLQTESHKDYLDWMCGVISPITSCSWWNRPERDLSIAGVETHSKPAIRIRTKSHPFFESFYNRMYPNGHKVIDPHYLTLLDWEFLAVWYQEDGFISGYLAKNKYPYLRMCLCTNGFSYAENQYLRIQLKDRLDIDSTVTPVTTKTGKRTYKLTISRSQIEDICDNIREFIVPSFEYKVNYKSTLERIGALKKSDDIVLSS
jgi:hypothetical protein